MAERILVLGGTRSGKSALAEALVAEPGAPVVVVATGAAGDAEMAERIAVHRERRPAAWTTLETTDLVAALRDAPPDAAVLVDALAGWLAARMTATGLWADAGTGVAPLGAAGRAGREAVLAEAGAVWAAAAARPGRTVVVADESGLGVVPADASTRRWLDLAGDVVQRWAATADRVVLAVAGRALDLPAPPAVSTGPAQGPTGRHTSEGSAAAVAPPAVSTRPAQGPTGRHTSEGAPVAVSPERPPASLGRPTAGEGSADLAAHGDRMVPVGALDLAVNVHGDGPPPHVRAAIAKALDDLGRYPDDRAARAAVAARHGRDPAEVCVTAGAAEAFWLLAAAARDVRRAVVVHPAFTAPEAALRAAGVPVEHVLRRPDAGWRLDVAAIPDDADLVVVGNPNNPTGTLDPPEVLAALCRPGRVTVVDEAFVDFVADPAASLAGRGDLPGLVVVRSITKLWGLAGLRAGYLLAAPDLVARCETVRQPWAVGVAALAALEVCAADESYRREVAATVAAWRATQRDALAALDGVTVWDAAACFLLLRVDDGAGVHRRLLDRGVAVRPSTFPGLSTDHLRVAVRDPVTSARLAAALAEVVTPPP